MKKIVIYGVQYSTQTGRAEAVTLRTITPSSSFVGFGRFGSINYTECKKLAFDLEPTATRFEVV